MFEKIRLLSNRQKLGLLILGFIILALPLLILTLQRATEYRQRAQETTTPFFALNPAAAKKSIGEDFAVQLMLTNPANVIGIDTILTFDPEILDVVTFQPQTDSPLNNVLLKTIDNKKGAFRYAVVSMTSSLTKEDIGAVTFRAKKEGITSINFHDAKLIIQDQLKALIPTNNVSATYTITSDNVATTSASLTLVPKTSTIPVGKPFTVDVYLNAGTNNITGASFTLSYNHLFPLQSVDISANPFNNLLINTIGNDSYQFTAVDTIGKEITGTVKLATLIFYPETPGKNFLVEFLNVQVTAQGKIGSIANATFSNAGTYNVEDNPVMPTSAPQAPTPTSTPTKRIIQGGADDNDVMNILDYNIWRDEYLGKTTTKKADFDKDGKVDLIDFSIFRNAFNPEI